MEINCVAPQVEKLVLHQLKNFFFDVDEKVIHEAICPALELIVENFSASNNARLFDGKDVVFNSAHSVTWMIFLYRLSHELGTGEKYKQAGQAPKEADYVYYLNKILHANDWYHQVKLPVHFMCEHPVGSVLGKAKYSDYLMVYQGTTIGGNRKGNELFYPVIGNNVLMYANSTILGDTHIGNNVIIAADSYLMNETIPDNCIVFGRTPNIVIKQKTEAEIKSMTAHIWKW